MKVIHSSLLPNDYLHTIFWAACCLGFFWLFMGWRIYCQLPFQHLHSPLRSGPATGFHIQPHLSTCAHQVFKNGPLSSRMLYLFRAWPFIYLSHCFSDGIPTSTRTNAGSSSRPRWSTPVLGTAVSFPLVNVICSWDTWILLWPQGGKSVVQPLLFFKRLFFSGSAFLFFCFPPPPPRFFPFPLLSQCDGCPDVPVWGLMAGLQGLLAMGAFYCL